MFFVQEACAAMCEPPQCLSMLAAVTAQRPLDFKSEFLAILAMYVSLLFMLQLTEFYIAFLYCVSMVKLKKAPTSPDLANPGLPWRQYVRETSCKKTYTDRY